MPPRGRYSEIRRPVITGLGIIAPCGVGKDDFWQGLTEGRSATRRIRSFETNHLACSVAAEVEGFNPTMFFRPRELTTIGRFAQFAVVAANLAVADARLNTSELRSAALCLGTATQGLSDLGEHAHQNFLASPSRLLEATTGLEHTAHAATARVQAVLDVRGPTLTIASACCTGIDVLAWGAQQIQAGLADTAVVGASEAPISKFILSLFAAGGYLSTWSGDPSQASRPYDLLRSGFVPAEGAGVLILEELQKAVARRAPLYAEIVGYASAGEGRHYNRADTYPATLSRAIVSALRTAGIQPSDLDYVCAHGNSLPREDHAETVAYHDALATHAYRAPISSIKSMIGQPFAAAGILQAAASALAIASQVIPPTINYSVPDPACDLDYVPNVARVARLRHVLLHSHSLGGHLPGSHSAMILKRVGTPP